jgi:hypothetical protein
VPFRKRPLLSRFTVVAAPKEIIDLIERFDQQIDAYKSGQYNETQLRREFLDPFFKASVGTSTTPSPIAASNRTSATAPAPFCCTFKEYPEKWDEIASSQQGKCGSGDADHESLEKISKQFCFMPSKFRNFFQRGMTVDVIPPLVM